LEGEREEIETKLEKASKILEKIPPEEVIRAIRESREEH
jgi:hypothetical protein